MPLGAANSLMLLKVILSSEYLNQSTQYIIDNKNNSHTRWHKSKHMPSDPSCAQFEGIWQAMLQRRRGESNI
jgi:hypothetical protein